MALPVSAFPPPKITPIVRPGASPWLLALAPTSRPGVPASYTVAVSAGVMTPVMIGVVLAALPGAAALPAGLVLIVAAIVALGPLMVAGARATRDDVVSAPGYTFRGVPIEGPALDLLADIQQRFRWAEKMFGEVPTGIRWTEVDGQVDVLLWEAAEHAAKVSALDVELRSLAYAAEGTAQAALGRELSQRRTAFWARLEETQREADDLAREASNTAAAARIALARTGSLFDLEVITPSGADLVARGTLAAARARLALLTEVWTELDETTALAGERLRLPPPDEPAP